MRNILILITIILQLLANSTFAYTYEKKLQNFHIIHIVKLNPKDYSASIVKADSPIFGRELVSSIAARAQATIAINGGFFHINKINGKPSGTLVIDGKIYNTQKGEQPLVIIKSGRISVDISKVKTDKDNSVSLVSGIPMLIKDGRIYSPLYDKKSEFYTKAHVRTAIGVDLNGNLIIVVAEHHYIKDITAISVGEIQSLMNMKGNLFAKEYKKQKLGDITLDQLKQIIKQEYSSENKEPQGLSILELAKLMQDLGCINALNLDGGGSSTLWIEGKVVNNIVGDKDESNGQKVLRPVSDAIIFKKK